MIKTVTFVLLSFVLSIITATTARAAGCGLNHTKIMQTLRHPPAAHDLLFIVAHRGVHGTIFSDAYKDTPENTRESLDNADKECFEAVEIDVRLSSDGVPVITHDANWGRELRTVNPTTGSCCFNPYDGSGYNPGVGDITAGQAKTYVVRPTTNLYGTSKWNEKGTTLGEILDHYLTKGYEFVIFIDVKDSPAFGKAWSEVASRKMYDRVVIKIAAKVFPDPATMVEKLRTIHNACQCALSDAAYINVMPVFQTSDIAPNNEFGSTGGESKVVASAANWASWNQRFPGEPFVAAVETNLKESGGILASSLIAAQKYNVTIGDFQPVPEFSQAGVNGSYYKTNGTCCARLEEYLYDGRPYGLPFDRYDDRPLMNFVKSHVENNFINLITTDNAIPLANFASQWGRRNTLKYFK